MIAELALMPGLFGDLFEAASPVVTASRVDFYGFVGEMNLDAVAVELDLVDPVRRPARDRSASPVPAR
jgi:hypothetical protein